MKLVLTTFFLVLAIATVNCAKYDVEIASVLKTLKSIDLPNADETIYDIIPIEVFEWLIYIDYDCVEEKLDMQNVDKRQIQDIKNLKEFQSLNVNNMKLFVAIGNAAKICTRRLKEYNNIGIHQILVLRDFSAKLIFPDVRLNKNRAEECFKWALSKVEPESPLVKGFNVNSMNYSISACEERTSIDSYRQSLDEQMKKLDIKSCDVDKYEQPREVGYNVMKMFLFSKVDNEISEYEEMLRDSVINFEADLLETQMNCILRDLRDLK